MLEINSDFEIRLENAGVKFDLFHITFQFLDKFYSKKKKKILINKRDELSIKKFCIFSWNGLTKIDKTQQYLTNHIFYN